MRKKTRRATAGVVLYITWKIEDARAARRRLSEGAAKGLFVVHSSTISPVEASALLTPLASLDEITGALWTDAEQLLRARLMMAEKEPKHNQAGWNTKHPRHNVFHRNLRPGAEHVYGQEPRLVSGAL